jgi:hypothetical protein
MSDMNIDFENIREADELLIRTANSEYRFSVIDPVERKGILSGGSLGEQARESVLLGSLDAADKSLACDTKGIKAGCRALFYLKAKTGIERLITSVITRAERVTRGRDVPRAA